MIIKVNELRIGNWAFENVANLEKGSYTLRHLKVDGNSIKSVESGTKLFPIPLTPEVLEKCGFKKNKDGDYECMNGVNIYQDEGGRFYNINAEFLTHFESVHQLQNWYYFNTGEELEYKP